ncbi:arginyl-tRNA synthetase [Helicobacter mustelae]|uniref:arginine--tRNA ligase n=1 Tax=Helicobacter mustelae TaxID=217 RepID=UPI000E0342ED|nr:arginine--tRNA ligase [Helicobacter mustelae]STP12131.1 arginyl-tRNA synthetase [Helicobacter mustelae]
MYQTIKKLLEDALDVRDITLEMPKNKYFGHYATPIAFTLAKTYKKSPALIAEELAKKCEDIRIQDTEILERDIEVFEKVEVIGGYINLTLCHAFLESMANKTLKAPRREPKKKRILLEYVSANPTGPLHIGHARGAIFGDSLAKIGKFLGYDIKTEYYINDAGAQIQMLGLSIMLAGQEHLLKQTVEYPENSYKGEYIIDLAKLAQERFGNDVFSAQHIPELSNFGKDLMLEEIKSNLEEVGITFDFFVSEKELYEEWDSTLSLLQKNDAIYEKDQKFWLKSQQFGDEKDRVIIRDDGEPTYLAGDIIYHNNKFARGYDSYINIWGADHHGYINRVLASLEHLGFDSKKLKIILAQMVSLLKDGQPYKMSKRAGNFILMKDVVADIGVDALRFTFLSKKLDTALEFDIKDLKKQDSSNPIFYINYANARIHTLFEKCEKHYNFANISLRNLENQDAYDLLFQALQLQRVLENAFEEYALQKVCEYLRGIAVSFHTFYNNYRILGSEEEAELLKVFHIVSHTLTLGLGLLGICIKTKM